MPDVRDSWLAVVALVEWECQNGHRASVTLLHSSGEIPHTHGAAHLQPADPELSIICSALASEMSLAVSWTSFMQQGSATHGIRA